jgi:hypothetical protein
MEDFIYIILGIVWLVISIIGGKKKKAGKTPQPRTSQSEPRAGETTQTPQNTGSDFEDMLEEFFGTGSKKTKTEPAPQPSMTKESPPSYDDYTPEIESLETIDSDKISEYKGTYAVDSDYKFSAEPSKAESMEEIIRSYQLRDKQIKDEDEKINVVDLDVSEALSSGIDFDARKAIIYSEIINRKYF